MLRTWLRRWFGIHTDAEIAADVESEPTIQNARKALEQADAILAELQEVERGAPPRPKKAPRRPRKAAS